MKNDLHPKCTKVGMHIFRALVYSILTGGIIVLLLSLMNLMDNGEYPIWFSKEVFAIVVLYTILVFLVNLLPKRDYTWIIIVISTLGSLVWITDVRADGVVLLKDTALAPPLGWVLIYYTPPLAHFYSGYKLQQLIEILCFFAYLIGYQEIIERLTVKIFKEKECRKKRGLKTVVLIAIIPLCFWFGKWGVLSCNKTAVEAIVTETFGFERIMFGHRCTYEFNNKTYTRRLHMPLFRYYRVGSDAYEEYMKRPRIVYVSPLCPYIADPAWEIEDNREWLKTKGFKMEN